MYEHFAVVLKKPELNISPQCLEFQSHQQSLDYRYLSADYAEDNDFGRFCESGGELSSSLFLPALLRTEYFVREPS